MGEMMQLCAWAQAANNEGQTLWMREGLVTEVPLQQVVIARISHVTSTGSRYAWDALRVLYLTRAENRRFEAVLELPQAGQDLSGRHLLVSVYAPVREYEMNAAAEAVADLLARNESVELKDGTPSDLAMRLTDLAGHESSLGTRVRRGLARR